ncbi:MAG: hypothetical protein RSE98_04400, partial [Anaerovoracaceae bacterium]
KKLISLFLATIMVLSLGASFCFAEEGITPYRTHAVTMTPVRTSATHVDADVHVWFDDIADRYVIAVVLQEKYGSSWRTAQGVYSSATYFRGVKKQSITVSQSWTVDTSKLYRLKIVSTDEYNNGSSYTDTTYSDPI